MKRIGDGNIPPWPNPLNQDRYSGLFRKAKPSLEPERFYFEARRQLLDGIAVVERWCEKKEPAEPDMDERKARQKKIPPTKRTRPMSLREAARLMGYGASRDAAEKLRAAIDTGAVPCETLTRQQHVFSLDDFPKKRWPHATA
jgi:site-specific DNA-cytosine methylase